MNRHARTTWTPGWPERLRARVGELGFASLRDLASAHDGIPMSSIVELLGGGFAPVQVAIAMGTEAQEQGWFSWFARDQLVRAIHAHCRSGWSGTDTSEFDRAHALASWSAFVKDFRGVDGDAVDAAARAVLENAPRGWEPEGANDPTIEAAVQPSISG